MSRGLTESRRARRTALTRFGAGMLWILPWLIGFSAFMALPIGLSFYYSLTDYPLLEPPVFVGLDNYRELLNDSLFWTAVRNTAIYAGVSIPIGTVLAIILAALLNSNVRGQTFFRSVVFVPTLVPVVAASIVWLWLFNGDYGLINRTLDLALVPIGQVFGQEWRGPNWLGDPGWAMPSLIIMSFWSVGQAVVIYLASMQDVPDALYEAADLDGFGVIGKFRHVTIPMISPVILFNVIMAIITALQVFVVPYIMTQGGPGRATYFYTMYLYDQAFVYGRLGYANAMAWIQLMIILGLTALVFIMSRRFVFYRSA